MRLSVVHCRPRSGASARRAVRALMTLAAFVVAWLAIAPASAFASSASFAFSDAAPASADGAALSLMTPRTPPPAPVDPSAKAPLCDPRGAIMFAPPPQMQDVEVTLDTGLTFDDCMAPASGEKHRAAPGRAPRPADASSASTDTAVITAVVRFARAARELLPAPAASTPCFRPGYRSTVDRPPRA